MWGNIYEQGAEEFLRWKAEGGRGRSDSFSWANSAFCIFGEVLSQGTSGGWWSVIRFQEAVGFSSLKLKKFTFGVGKRFSWANFGFCMIWTWVLVPWDWFFGANS
jgi:hypothetical protein